MNNRTYMLTEKGLFRMDANYRWSSQEAPARGLRDPWQNRPDTPLRTEGMTAWRAERDEYMRQRDEWIAMEIFNEYGYDDFLAEAANLSEEFRNSVRPCDSRHEPQCNMFCAQYNNCAL